VTELIGKHLGMFIDKKSIEISYVDDSDEYLARIMEIVNAKVIDHEPAALQLTEDGQEYGLEGSGKYHATDIIYLMARGRRMRYPPYHCQHTQQVGC
jgi:hypothetical protein